MLTPARHGSASSTKLAAAAAAVVLATVLGGPTAMAAGGARSEAGLETGRGHMVHVLRRNSVGLEAGMPREGAYRKALELDLQGKYYKAYRMQRQAEREFRSLARLRSGDKRPVWWQRKASTQRSISYRINRYYRYYRRSRYRYYRRYYQQYNNAFALHQKWLALRAFGLRPGQKLALEAVKLYEGALKQRSTYTIARLYLAGLYGELGRLSDARRVFAPATKRYGYSTRVAAAYYHTVMGNRDRALELLTHAARRSSWIRRQVFIGNLFDALRGDPRFQALVAHVK